MLSTLIRDWVGLQFELYSNLSSAFLLGVVHTGGRSAVKTLLCMQTSSLFILLHFKHYTGMSRKGHLQCPNLKHRATGHTWVREHAGQVVEDIVCTNVYQRIYFLVLMLATGMCDWICSTFLLFISLGYTLKNRNMLEGFFIMCSKS